MLDYGVTFLHTPIFIDNSSAIRIVNNPVKHSKTKHIEIRYHFIRDCNGKKLIQVVKFHTDNQFADLFTKAFDEMYSSTHFITSLKVQEHSSSMASVAFIDEHNEIAMLQKPKQAEGFHQIVDFLKSSHIAHALTESPTIFIRHQRQFWANATIVTEDGVQMIKTRVCEKPLTVTEEVIRICLRLDDAAGITSIPNEELFSTLTRMGFVQAVITNELMDIPHFDGVYVPKPPKGKVFSNMRRSVGDSEGVDTPLFSTMMVVSHTDEGMAAGSKPSSDHPTASQSQPSHFIPIPQSLLQKPTSPITQTYKTKQVKKAPSFLVPSPTKPLSPLLEHSPIENIQRESNRVSPNPQEVLSKEMEEHMGEKAATTSPSTEKDSGNIPKTFPMETLGEQSSKGPRCQEPKGADSASAKQKASTTKRSNDHSKGGNIAGEGEDKYNYDELMETIGNINMDVIKQGQEIEELKLIVLSQQDQILNLKQMSEADENMEHAKAKGEQENAKFEGEQITAEEVAQEAETQVAAETINTAGTSRAAEMVNTAEPMEAVETMKEVLTDLEIAETLIKAKHDTPKVISKAKGVVIKERGDASKRSSKEKEMSKEKGKEKLVQPDQPMKKQKLIDSDEALARKIQAELEEAETMQVQKDREIAKAMAAELNKAYQQSLATEQAKQKATSLRKPAKIKMAARKRQPSKTYLGAQERKKMITFLKGAVGVKVEMFSKMSFEKLKKMYDAEMIKLQGDDLARVEMEKRMKESNDFLQKPFPDEQE
ncbi:hypothetical protein L6452_15047 [Arctium lappa]|uniref:Uncharacterized protein n=1 Tax=Arctium lappa TaxID=4217 RepID=A0ACB9CMX3_ARCLA|nr:hypothetical protein L6452_15047 [Arctium lappa]